MHDTITYSTDVFLFVLTQHKAILEVHNIATNYSYIYCVTLCPYKQLWYVLNCSHLGSVYFWVATYSYASINTSIILNVLFLKVDIIRCSVTYFLATYVLMNIYFVSSHDGRRIIYDYSYSRPVTYAYVCSYG